MAEKKRKQLTVEEILAAVDLKDKQIDCPEWGGYVTIRGFSKDVQQQMRAKAMRGEDIDNDVLELEMLRVGVVDPVIPEDQILAFKAKSAGAIDRVLTAIMEASGIAKEDDEKVAQSFRTE